MTHCYINQLVKQKTRNIHRNEIRRLEEPVSPKVKLMSFKRVLLRNDPLERFAFWPGGLRFAHSLREGSLCSSPELARQLRLLELREREAQSVYLERAIVRPPVRI